MAYQKLNVSRAWEVSPSDNAPIPQIMVKDGTQTVVSNSGNTITVDPAIDLLKLGIVKGMIIVNPGGDSAIINSVSGNEITLNIPATPFGPTSKFDVYGGNSNGAVLYVGTAGNVRVLTSGGDDVTFSAVQAGSFIPVNVIKVYDTSTTASDILALW
tara:strand:- start:3389 stop:3859 length:471 start_codon:yes stop_codon:yes gene_type:complete